jgi:hypothetical protein
MISFTLLIAFGVKLTGRLSTEGVLGVVGVVIVVAICLS